MPDTPILPSVLELNHLVVHHLMPLDAGPLPITDRQGVPVGTVIQAPEPVTLGFRLQVPNPPPRQAWAQDATGDLVMVRSDTWDRSGYSAWLPDGAPLFRCPPPDVRWLAGGCNVAATMPDGAPLHMQFTRSQVTASFGGYPFARGWNQRTQQARLEGAVTTFDLDPRAPRQRRLALLGLFLVATMEVNRHFIATERTQQWMYPSMMAWHVATR